MIQVPFIPFLQPTERKIDKQTDGINDVVTAAVID
jgi:hypothetical protein